MGSAKRDVYNVSTQRSKENLHASMHVNPVLPGRASPVYYLAKGCSFSVTRGHSIAIHYNLISMLKPPFLAW